MLGTIEHASESCGVYSCKYLIRSNTVGITSTLSIGDGDTGRYLSIDQLPPIGGELGVQILKLIVRCLI